MVLRSAFGAGSSAKDVLNTHQPLQPRVWKDVELDGEKGVQQTRQKLAFRLAFNVRTHPVSRSGESRVRDET